MFSYFLPLTFFSLVFDVCISWNIEFIYQKK